MGYLERLFLGSMLLTALFILFLFGLYFDFGAMFVGGFVGSGMRPGLDLEMIRQRRRLAIGDEVREPVGRRPEYGTPQRRPSSEVDYDAFVRRPETVPMEVLVEREVRRLKRRGHTDREFIRMRAVYEVDRSLVSIFDQYDRLIEAGDHEAAIDLLREARQHVPEDNPLMLRDILQYLQQAYVLAGRQAEASRTLREMISLQERVFAIEQRADRYKDSEGQEYLETMQENFGHLREALDKLETAPPEMARMNPLSRDVIQGFQDPDAKVPVREEHLRKMKLELLKRANSRGSDSLSPEQIRQVMSQFEGQ